ncbi:DUF4037 domain-containing protein [Pseudonocardia acaciae]|uniref:DUF4037 domain-containing protein n=1 Tax=Pseudonocardia acaciae TaxID=551276 RepID=UPI000A6044D3|nr:DUF4037 domain-containing protein [Pseudonocardia acaciae]
MTSEFVPGLRLARGYHGEVVRPLLERCFPGLRHTAALIGPGSEVLGFDGERSTDHDWGARLQIFLTDEDARRAGEVDAMLTRRLPASWRGHPTAFARTRDPRVRHRVECTTLGAYLGDQLGFDPRAGVTTADWLATPTQRLAEVTGGAVFHDGPGELTAARAALAWYPEDVWRYVLACQWQRIAEEEAFPGRCAEAGDPLGSGVVAARLVRDLMRLCLLMRRRYPPYSKWLGTAFARLPPPDGLPADLAGALTAPDWPTREKHLVAAYGAVAREHNGLGLTEPLDPATRRFHDRPYQVLDAERFGAALRAGIENPELRRRPPTGAIDQFADNTTALADPRLSRPLGTAWRRSATPARGLPEPGADGDSGAGDHRDAAEDCRPAQPFPQ